jgi:hypothetical protein
MQSLNLTTRTEIPLSVGNDVIQPLPMPVLTREIPNISMFNAHLDGFDDKIRKLKMENLQYSFITKVQAVLDLFDKDSNRYSNSIMLFVMTAVENHILKPRSGFYKHSVVVECVKKYYDDNVELVEQLIKLNMPTLKQNKLLKRTGKRLLRFFFKWRKMK